jgi:lactoylglutathione lyase
MPVLRIVADIATPDPARAAAFYGDFLGLDLCMDLGFIHTYGSDQTTTVQISFASQGGSDTPVPDLSIEVTDAAQLHQRARALGLPIEYPLTREPWGVTRFYTRDPFGKLVNILSHTP